MLAKSSFDINVFENNEIRKIMYIILVYSLLAAFEMLVVRAPGTTKKVTGQTKNTDAVVQRTAINVDTRANLGHCCYLNLFHVRTTKNTLSQLAVSIDLCTTRLSRTDILIIMLCALVPTLKPRYSALLPTRIRRRNACVKWF